MDRLALGLLDFNFFIQDLVLTPMIGRVPTIKVPFPSTKLLSTLTCFASTGANLYFRISPTKHLSSLR